MFEVKITLKQLTEALLAKITQTHGPSTASDLKTIADRNLPTYVALYAENDEVFNTSENLSVDESSGSDDDNACIFLVRKFRY